MQHIETVTVGSGGAASITFMAVGDIPATFTDLVLKFSLRNDTNNDEIGLVLNGATTPFTQRNLRGEGTTVLSQSRTNNLLQVAAGKSVFTADTFGNCELYIPNYRSGANKSISFDGSLENNATDGRNGINSILWSNTAAITSIQLTANSNFVQHSSASLYGITAGSDGITAVS